MYVPEYNDREEAARYSLDAEGIFPGVDLAQVIRAAGNTALYDDLILTPDVNANKQDGPRSAIYLVANLSSGMLLTAGRLHPNTDDKELIEADKLTIEASVKDYVNSNEILDKQTFILANNITTIVAFPGRRDSLLSAGVELRVAPNNVTYVALLIPSYFRLAPEAITRYLTNMRRKGRADVNPNLKDLAYINDTRKVARLLSVSAVCHILDNYVEKEQLETQFKDD